MYFVHFGLHAVYPGMSSVHGSVVVNNSDLLPKFGVIKVNIVVNSLYLHYFFKLV